VPRCRRIALWFGTLGVAALWLPPVRVDRGGRGRWSRPRRARPSSRSDNFAFTPADLTVTAGTTVTWKNEDDSPHRIGDKNGTFKSAAVDTDDSFLAHLCRAGRIPVYLHDPSYMVGKIDRQTRRAVLLTRPSPYPRLCALAARGSV